MATETAVAQRRAEVKWEGDLRQGKGVVSLMSGAAKDLPVTWAARTEEPDGKTSPEELIAGAHAACYAMALSNTLAQEGSPPERLLIEATCSLTPQESGYRITSVELSVRASIKGLDAMRFEQLAQKAELGCPVSNALRNNVKIILRPELEPV